MADPDENLFPPPITPLGQSYGQWVGRQKGTNEGLVVLDLDLRAGKLRGTAHVFDDSPNLPVTIAFIEDFPISLTHTAEVLVAVVHPDGRLVSADDFAAAFPGVTAPNKADISTHVSEDGLFVKWQTDIGTSGTAILKPSQSGEPSNYKPADGQMGWQEYKEFVLGLERDRFIYRGQPAPYRLRTSFHRTRRSDLHEYVMIDIPALHRGLSARTSHYFNLSDPSQNGAFYNLIQHHGYPTPLLDWTYSPYVAAYFAFRQSTRSESHHDVVRVYLLDKMGWTSKYRQIQQLSHARPHFSLLEPVAIENERIIPQQALSSLTNVDDIESYISSMENSPGEFLRAIDITRDDRERALWELSMMGITAGSMFPGLDGACEELRSRFFDR